MRVRYGSLFRQVQGVFFESAFQVRVENEVGKLEVPEALGLHIGIIPVGGNPDAVILVCVDENRTHPGTPRYGEYKLKRRAYEDYPDDPDAESVKEALVTVHAFLKVVAESIPDAKWREEGHNGSRGKPAG